VPLESEIEFVASYFHELKEEDFENLRELKCETIEGIVSSDKLQLSDEDSLVEFISSLGEEKSNLYDYVECHYLSVEGIDKFVEGISNREFGESPVWSSICRRLRCEVVDRKLMSSRYNCFESYDYKVPVEFNGIICGLTKRCGGNVHEKGVVEITSSSEGRHKPCQLADYGWQDYWYSNDVPNSWVCFDFKKMSICLNHYTLKSADHPYFLLQWELEGSNDKQTWTSLDRRNTRELAGKYLVKTFECEKVNFYRFIRLRQTGPNSVGLHCLLLSNIEFFGDVKFEK
jgi:hypothetical protein